MYITYDRNFFKLRQNYSHHPIFILIYWFTLNVFVIRVSVAAHTNYSLTRTYVVKSLLKKLLNNKYHTSHATFKSFNYNLLFQAAFLFSTPKGQKFK